VRTARVAVFGGDELRASVVALGFEPSFDRPGVALVDLAVRSALADATAVPRDVPRVLVAPNGERDLLDALGIDPARVVTSREPAALGPALLAAIPAERRSPTRTVVVTGVRGGVGRTLLVTNLARRIAPDRRVCVVDATGTGAAAWWFGAAPGQWSELEGLVEEMSADHLSVLAHQVSEGLRVIGGPGVTPSAGLLRAVARAAAAFDDLVLVDAPFVFDPLSRAVDRPEARRLIVSYEDAASLAALTAADMSDDDWLIASQSRAARLDTRPVLRALPRDEPAIASALASRAKVGGALGRAYDELTELLRIDAS
jgi:hypothetical protein